MHKHYITVRPKKDTYKPKKKEPNILMTTT